MFLYSTYCLLVTKVLLDIKTFLIPCNPHQLAISPSRKADLELDFIDLYVLQWLCSFQVHRIAFLCRQICERISITMDNSNYTYYFSFYGNLGHKICIEGKHFININKINIFIVSSEWK